MAALVTRTTLLVLTAMAAPAMQTVVGVSLALVSEGMETAVVQRLGRLALRQRVSSMEAPVVEHRVPHQTSLVMVPQVLLVVEPVERVTAAAAAVATLVVALAVDRVVQSTWAPTRSTLLATRATAMLK
jgi:hypothetical protein